MSGFSAIEGMDAWIDFGREASLKNQLMVTMPGKLFKSRRGRDFWLEFTTPNGTCMGWIRFTYFTAIKNQAIFVSVEMRPGDAPSPRREDVLLGA